MTRYNDNQHDLSKMTTGSTSKKKDSITDLQKTINDLGWKDPAERRRGTHLTLFYKILNCEVKVPSEGIIILVRGRTSQAHNTFLHIESKIDIYNYSFYQQTIPEWNKLQSTYIIAPNTETFKNRLKVMLLPVHACISAFLTLDQHLYFSLIL